MTPAAVKVTSGGKWDPTSGNLAFLAGGGFSDGVVARPEIDCVLIAVNEIGQGQKAMDAFARMCEGRRIMLDSGVFSLASEFAREHEVGMGEAFAAAPEDMPGWDALYDRWCSIATRFEDQLWGVVELDQGGKDAVARTRAQVERDTGIVAMPVYHPFSDGWDYYDQLAGTHDRICVGGLAGRIPSAVRMRLCWTVADRARAHPHLWTHLLGVTPSPMVLSYGLRGSTDSSAWLGPVRWSQSWRAAAMTQRVSDMPLGMVYRRDLPGDTERGAPKARAQCAAAAHFQGATVTSVAHDTHPRLEIPR